MKQLNMCVPEGQEGALHWVIPVVNNQQWHFKGNVEKPKAALFYSYLLSNYFL